MKTFLITTALATGLALPAFAESHTGNMTFLDSTQSSATAAAELRVSDLIGKRIYAAEAEIDVAANEVSQGWDDIGEINDVIMSRDGETRAVLLDIGGFLGIGEKTVAVNMDELKLVADGDDAGDYFVVFTSSRAGLEAAPEFNSNIQGGWTDAKVDAETPHMTMKRDGYETYDVSKLTAEMVTGAPVYDQNDEHIGEVSKLVLNDAGEITEAVIDVGGFLGLGEKPVGLKMDELDILRETDGDDLRVYVDQTKEGLEALPEWKSES